MKCDPEALKIDPHGCIAQLIKIIDITLRLQIKLHKALFDERRLKVVQNMECEPGALEINPHECTVQLYLANILWQR